MLEINIKIISPSSNIKENQAKHDNHDATDTSLSLTSIDGLFNTSNDIKRDRSINKCVINMTFKIRT